MLVPAQGSSGIGSERLHQQRTKSEIDDKTPVASESTLSDDRVVEDTFINRTSVNKDLYRDKLSQIAGYPEGIPIHVTYFSKNQPITDMRTADADVLTSAQNSVHESLTQIDNFEIRLDAGMEFSYNSEENISETNGTGLTYPGFQPKITDFFYYELQDNQFGKFVITDCQATAIGQGKCHKINFVMRGWVTRESRDEIQKRVTAKRYFDRTKFVAGDMSLLTSDEYVIKIELEKLRKEIISEYLRRYYNSSYGTLMRPDGIYDPYAVVFWTSKISVSEGHGRPKQLFPSVSDYQYTLFGVLTSQTPTRNINKLMKRYYIEIYRNTFWSPDITGLINREYLIIGDPADKNFFKQRRVGYYGQPSYYPEENIESYRARIERLHRDIATWRGEECDKEVFEKNFPIYIFSEAFYDGSGLCSEIETITRNLLKNSIDPKAIYRLVSQYTSWNEYDAFYHLLISIHLIDAALYQLIYSPPKLPPVSF